MKTIVPEVKFILPSGTSYKNILDMKISGIMVHYYTATQLRHCTFSHVYIMHQPHLKLLLRSLTSKILG